MGTLFEAVLLLAFAVLSPSHTTACCDLLPLPTLAGVTNMLDTRHSMMVLPKPNFKMAISRMSYHSSSSSR
jgi:hypothetical protein